MSLNRLNTKSANVLENPLKKIYYYEITKLIAMQCTASLLYISPKLRSHFVRVLASHHAVGRVDPDDLAKKIRN
jgi:hypothetical protein